MRQLGRILQGGRMHERARRIAIEVLAVALLALSSRTAAADAGYAIELDGISGYLGRDLGATRGMGTITLSAWILTAGPRGELISPEPRGQAAVGLGFHFGLSAGKVTCSKGNGSGTYVTLIGQTAIPVSEWHHVAATFDGATMRVYVDGTLDGSLDDNTPIVWDDLPAEFPPGQLNYPQPAQLFLGADKHNALGLGPTIPDFEFFEGCIDEAQVWSRALTQGEIETYRHLSLSGAEPGLVDYWKFDEGTGTVAADETHLADLTLFPGAIWKVSGAPVSVTAAPPSVGPRAARLRVLPNPARGSVTVLLETPSHDAARVSVFDLTGRRIADLGSGTTAAPGALELRWNGRNEADHAVPNGVYLVRCESSSMRLTTRLLILR